MLILTEVISSDGDYPSITYNLLIHEGDRLLLELEYQKLHIIYFVKADFMADLFY